MTLDDYAGYGDWKGWSPDFFFRCTDRQKAYYSGELMGFEFQGARVLEIGFGNGEFLAFARSRGATILGIEVLDELVTLAKERGLEFVAVGVASLDQQPDRSLDLIVGFDVMEHLTLEENMRLLAQVDRLLRPGGRFIARFPNGQSPFGRAYQHGDHTHRSTLSPGIVIQLIQGTGLKLVSARDQFVPILGPLWRRVLVHAKHTMRRCVEHALRMLYDFDFPMGPNVVIELRPKA